MINFRVSDFDKLLEQLRPGHVKIDDKKMDGPFRKSAWVYYTDGNKIELWQPMDEG